MTEDIVALLTNWGHWARVRPHYGHCYSVENRYHSPQIWHPPGPRIEVDALSALQIERCMRHVPYLHRLALKLVYVYRVPARAARRAVCVPHDLWDTFLWQAQQMVWNRLTSRKPAFRMRASTDLPPALLAPDGAGCYGEKEVEA